MTFSREWNSAIKDGHQRPEHGMTAHMAALLHNLIGNLKGQRLLELGCASGLASTYLLEQGVDYYGIDGREEAIRKAATIGGAHFACADFTKEQPFPGEFDIVIDRASVPHNRPQAIRECIGLIWRALKPGGVFISADWFSSHHSELMRGEVIDEFTRTHYPDGQFKGVGVVHFSDEQDLWQFFQPFERPWLQERLSVRPRGGVFLHGQVEVPWIAPFYRGREYVSAVWDIMVRKPR